MRFLVMLGMLMGILFAGEEPQRGAKRVVTQTPFGPSLREAAPEGAGAAKGRAEVKDNAMLQIEEKGDTVRFRRRTPFGEQSWERKRSELTAVERKMMAARARTREKEAAQAPTPAGGERTP